MYRITKRFTFDAAHKLEGLPEGHKCGRIHGHTYVVEVTLAGDSLQDEGWVIDFGELTWLKKHIDDTFDHRYLNDVVAIQPTSENLAEYFFLKVKEWLSKSVQGFIAAGTSVWVDCVKVSETPNTSAEYYEHYEGE